MMSKYTELLKEMSEIADDADARLDDMNADDLRELVDINMVALINLGNIVKRTLQELEERDVHATNS